QVTSLAREGIDVTMRDVVDAFAARAGGERHDVASRPRRANVTTPVSIARKPAWLRVQANMGEGYRELKRTMRSFDLVTVCEEAGCPNIFECWAAGTATFMING